MKTTIQLAREAGFNVKNFTTPVITAQHSNGSWVSVGDELETFATLLRAEWEAAQPRQEPVGFVGAGYITLGEGRISETQTDVYRVPVYLAPPAQPQQERVYLVATGEVYEGQETYTRHDVLPPLCEAETLYTAPPAQPAAQPQPLTDEHIAELLIKHLESNDGYYQFARAIEAHHNIRSKE